MSASRGENPVFTVVAGPNGSGKSTFVDEMAERGKSLEPFINPDNIARALAEKSGKDQDSSEIQMRAGRQALSETKSYIEDGQSFARETTLTSKEILRSMEAAKESGFRVNLIYVATNDLETNKARIEERVQRGEHAIPTDTQDRRFQRSLDQASKAASIADSAVFLHSSTKGHQVVAVVEKGGLKLEDHSNAQWLKSVTEKLELQKDNDDTNISSIDKVSLGMKSAVADIKDPERLDRANEILARSDERNLSGKEEDLTPERRGRDDHVPGPDGPDDFERD